MMKRARFFLGCLLSIVVASAASAAWVPLTEVVSLSSLQGEPLIFGDKEISEFELFAFGGGGALDPNPDEMFVQGGQDDATGNYGLKFNLSWGVGSHQAMNATLNFKVAILPDYDECFLDDALLILTAASATGTGVVSVAETVWDAPFPEGNVVASLSCSKQEGDGGTKLMAHGEFTPFREIWVLSKDISITGGTGEDGTAHLSEFYQFYSQVPEPATGLLFLLGSCLAFTRHRTERQN